MTVADSNMWLIPYTDGESHTLQVRLPHPQNIAGVRLWNYNKSAEDTYRGVSNNTKYLHAENSVEGVRIIQY